MTNPRAKHVLLENYAHLPPDPAFWWTEPYRIRPMRFESWSRAQSIYCKTLALFRAFVSSIQL